MAYKPKFLTVEVAQAAVRSVWVMVSTSPDWTSRLKRLAGHVVVMVPDSAGEYFVLYEESFGNESEWSNPYDCIARSKANQLAFGRNDGRTSCMPHLLCPGDVKYWGGVKREGAVVAFSGVQPYLDRTIAGMVAETCVGFAHHAFVEWEISDKAQDDGFVRIG